MNQTVSEKLPVDYLFVMDNSEPKQFVFSKTIAMKRFLQKLTLN